MTLRPAGPLRPEDPNAGATAPPDPSGINAPSQLDNSGSDHSASISIFELLASRGNNLLSKQRPPLPPIENVIETPSTEPQPDPAPGGGVIVHVKPAVDTAIPPQDLLKDHTDSEHRF